MACVAHQLCLILLLALVCGTYGQPANRLIKPANLGGVDAGNCTVNACATLNYALSISAASGDRITVGLGTYSVPASPASLIDVANLNGKSIIIEGTTKGQCTFDAGLFSSANSLFQWDSTSTWQAASVTFKNIDFKGGTTHSGKSFLRLSDTNNRQVEFGSLSFIDCAFRNIRLDSSGSNGGVVSVDTNANVALTFTNVIWDTLTPATAAAPGGALHWGSVAATASLVINGPGTTDLSPTSVFRNCRSNRGGAISFSGTWGVPVQITNTLFEANTAVEAGGAISTISSTGNQNNRLILAECSFKNNNQGTLSTTDSNNLGGGALAISQGDVRISGLSTKPCTFTGNNLSRQANSALASRGGAAIRVTATTVDGDTSPLVRFSVTDCIFSDNQVTVMNAIGAPIYVYGTSAEVNAMSVKPTLTRVTFVGNRVITDDASAAGLQYIVPDAAVSPVNACVLQACSFSTDSPDRYDIILNGGMRFSGAAPSIVGRIKAVPVSAIFVDPGASLTLQPQSLSNSLDLGSSGTLINEGTLRFSELSLVQPPTATLTNRGTLYISRGTSMSSLLRLDATTSTLNFGIRSATDYGVLTTTNNPLLLAGAVGGVAEGGFAPAGPLVLNVIMTPGSVSGAFSSSSCSMLPGTCSASIEGTNMVVMRTAGPGDVPIGAIIGAVVGGVVFLAIIILIVALVVRKRRTVKENVALPNPAFDPSVQDNEMPHRGQISPKGARALKMRSDSVSGDPSVDATLQRAAATTTVEPAQDYL